MDKIDYERIAFLGLAFGQIWGGSYRVTKNSGWYNEKGEKIGFGDLSRDNFKTITEKLLKGEYFVVLSETDASWNFNAKGFLQGSKKKIHIDAPGVDYVSAHATWVITQGKIFKVDSFNSEKGKTVTWRGVHALVLKKDKVKDLITGKLLA